MNTDCITEAGSVKRCKVCGALKNLDEFYRDKRTKNGHLFCCKACGKEQNKKWRSENPEKVRETKRRWKDKNLEKERRWWAENPEKARGYARKWRAKNAENIRKAEKRWRAENHERFKEICRRAKKKYLSTPKRKLHKTISGGVYKSLNGSKAGRSWEGLVGYTVNDLKKRLERLFQPGMSWDNYGQWHVDHIIPMSAFNFKTSSDTDFKKCWALKNLQPMWAKDNIKKSNKLDKPFQPSFMF